MNDEDGQPLTDDDEWNRAWDTAVQWLMEGGEDEAELADRLGLDDLAEQIRTGREELERQD